MILSCAGQTVPLLYLCVPVQREWRPKIPNYVESIVTQSEETDMLRTFRLSETAMDILTGIIKSARQIRPTSYARGRPAVS